MNIVNITLILTTIVTLFIFLFPESNEYKYDLSIIKSSDLIEKYLSKYEDVIGDDLPGYRGHIYRVLTYTMHILHHDESFKDVIELSLVYHDIGLWTSKVLSYLEPSSELAKKDTRSLFTLEESELLFNCIYWHHKITPFTGQHEKIVNAVRKADWIDATQGLVHFGMPRKFIKEVNDAIPNNGFHYTLLTIGSRYYGYDFFRIVKELSSILKW